LIRKFLRMLFGLKLKDRLDRAPRMYSNPYDRRVSRDVARVFARSAARSPTNVEQLMRQHKVKSVEELLILLPDRQRRANPRARLRAWLTRISGLLPYDPLPSRLNRLRWEGQHPDYGTLILRTKWPLEETKPKGGDPDA
jgi:hypothetical protein